MRLPAAVVVTLTFVMMSIFWLADPAVSAQAPDGKTIFRFDTFKDEQLWTNVLRMHEAISEVSPSVALKVGLKVDVEALPAALIELHDL